ncbi:preprotein translocase subunit SecY [bacterium (Candidatus Moisslbacteria) CG12_big_fil_rev_8_21_14_0_65_36_11]|nr:preprotein translocase subunit SecY [Candidatus Kuenenbacteria bacterium]OIP76331.1 MAG: preprotein translocase subunit SecY [Parcubacteria group bacterium CG2_30_36_38]PIW67826.1 MAG: preprotein translocase subunit SecY [bacterium (Candidatus Moisslbacteria) CG12_big_fil_rev_8_21_14_0_65_36_11]
MNFVGKFKQIWRIRPLRNSILFIFFILAIFRIGSHIPMPGVDLVALKDLFARNQMLGMLNLLTGGAMSTFSVVALGLGPYITASIIIQLLTMVIPALEELSHEGQAGYQKMENYTRFLTVPLAFLQAYSIIKLFSQGSSPIISLTHSFDIFSTILVMTAGTMFLVWLGDLITERKIGNGVSLLIFAGIVDALPLTLQKAVVSFTAAQVVDWLVLSILAVVTIATVALIARAQRNIPVTYARQIRGNKMYGGMDTYLPLKVNQAGMIPIIFAISIVMFPSLIGQFMSRSGTVWLAKMGKNLMSVFQNQTIYGLIYFFLVVAFTYFYTAIIFHPEQIAENLQKQGAFIPGLRPGQPTSKFLHGISKRIMFTGALFLGLIAILPIIVQGVFKTTPFVVGGAAVLIVVSVVLETLDQIDAQITMYEYEGI